MVAVYPVGPDSAPPPERAEGTPLLGSPCAPARAGCPHGRTTARASDAERPEGCAARGRPAPGRCPGRKDRPRTPAALADASLRPSCAGMGCRCRRRRSRTGRPRRSPCRRGDRRRRPRRTPCPVPRCRRSCRPRPEALREGHASYKQHRHRRRFRSISSAARRTVHRTFLVGTVPPRGLRRTAGGHRIFRPLSAACRPIAGRVLPVEPDRPLSGLTARDRRTARGPAAEGRGAPAKARRRPETIRRDRSGESPAYVATLASPTGPLGVLPLLGAPSRDRDGEDRRRKPP